MSQKEMWQIRKMIQRLIPFNKNSRCEECGRKKNLHRHHRDSNIRNNVLDNIEVVCAKCHVQIHLEIGTWSHGLEYLPMAAD